MNKILSFQSGQNGQTEPPQSSNQMRTIRKVGNGYLRDKDRTPPQIFFTRQELDQILRLYGMMVAAGEWRDYAMASNQDGVTFAIHQRASERPLFSVKKIPALARKQGQFVVLGQAGQVLRRGHDLGQVLKVLEKKALKLIDG